MDNELGRRIKRLREQKRWSQQHLADLLGVSTKSISNWERGKFPPRNSVGALEGLFGVDLSVEQPAPADSVEAAIRGSELDEYRQYEVIGFYKKHLQEQRAREAG